MKKVVDFQGLTASYQDFFIVFIFGKNVEVARQNKILECSPLENFTIFAKKDTMNI